MHRRGRRPLGATKKSADNQVSGSWFASCFRNYKFIVRSPPVSIHVALNHVTHYRYDRLINLGPQVVRLRPRRIRRTRILSYSLKIGPDKHFINWQQDPQGNYLARLVFPEKTREFSIEVDLVAEMSVHQSVRLLPRAVRREFPVRVRGLAAPRADALPRQGATVASGSTGTWRAFPARRCATSIFWSR